MPAAGKASFMRPSSQAFHLRASFTTGCASYPRLYGVHDALSLTEQVGDYLGGWSAVFSFVTPPPTGTVGEPLIFGMFGDMGTVM